MSTWEPDCMEPDEWSGWQAANRGLTHRGDRAKRPCDDCPLGFAVEMRAEGRCNGTPAGVQEDDDMDTEVTARPPAKEPVMARARVAVEAPCRTCSHAPVCRLRDAVIDAGSITIPVPALGDGVTIALTGTVDCDWYAKDRPARSEPKERRPMTEEQREAARQRMLHARAIGVAKKASEAA